MPLFVTIFTRIVFLQMEILIVLGWLLCLTTGTKKTPIQPAYSLCVNAVPCQCRRDIENRLSVDCSNLNLTNIPTMPNDTVFLSLRENEIIVVENRTFSNLPHLLSLDLSSNSIRRIMRDGLQGLENLRRLDLDDNNVPLTVNGFETGVFRELKNLCFLSIQNVQGRRDNSSYPHEIFAGLMSLTTLKIDGKPNAIFGPGFSRLHNLRMLTLSSDKCNIDSVFNSTFVNLPFLTGLDISFCNIHRIEPGALIPLRHLQYLDISDNVALSLDGLRNAPFGLINGSITILKANKLYPTFPLSVEVHSKHFEYLNQTNIKKLYLDENQIELIESDWGNVCPRSMELLSVSGNKLTFGLYVFQGFRCKSLKIFNGGYQHSTHMPFSSTSKVPYLRKNIEDFPLVTDFESRAYDTNRPNCSDNNEEHSWDFWSYCNISSDHRYTRHLNIMPPAKQSTSGPNFNGKDENIKNENAAYDNTSFSGTIFPIFVPPNLEEIHFQFADLRYEIPEINFRNSSVTFMNVSGEEIAANIANAIHRSRKTVVLLDDDFLSSYWCMYELNMARMESVYSRKGENILILLVKEEMDKSKLPLELLDLIHKETYIELPEDLVDVDMSDICSRLRETIMD